MSDRKPLNDELNDEMREALRRYHEPGETPREEMWQAIVGRVRAESGASTATPENDLARPRSDGHVPWLHWAAAASAVLLVGVALGRSTAPDALTTDGLGAPAAAPALAGVVVGSGGLDVVVRGHLGRTESLLTAVRSDGRQGRLDPTAADWARGLLTQTRLLLDARAGGDPALVALLEELELVLAGIVLVAESGSLDEPRARAELDLVLETLELGALLPRLQAACSRGCVASEV